MMEEPIMENVRARAKRVSVMEAIREARTEADAWTWWMLEKSKEGKREGTDVDLGDCGLGLSYCEGSCCCGLL